MKQFPLTLIIAIGASITRAHAITLTFDNPRIIFSQDAYGDGEEYTEQGFKFYSISDPGYGGSIIRFDPSASTSIPSNGTPHFGNTLFSNPSFSSLSGVPFSLLSIDVAQYSISFPWQTATFVGHLVDGGTLTASFPTGSRFITYEFPSTWSGLIKVDITSEPIAWDNVVVVPVPEPSNLALLCSLSATIFCKRRRPQ